MSHRRDAYEILGVEKTADAKALKSAYRKLAMKYHPDRCKDEDAGDKFDEVQKVYDILSDDKKRALYDRGGYDAVDGAKSGGAGYTYRRPSFSEMAKTFGMENVRTPEDDLVVDRKGKGSSAFLERARRRAQATAPQNKSPASKPEAETETPAPLKPQGHVRVESELRDMIVESLRAAGERDLADMLGELPVIPDEKSAPKASKAAPAGRFQKR